MRSTRSPALSAPAVDAAGAPDEAGRALVRTLFAELGFRGNTDDYYDPRNSFLTEVLDRRAGIPITLSVLYLEVARRVGVGAAGVGFPGHFLVRVDGGAEPLILDPFGGRRGARPRPVSRRCSPAPPARTARLADVSLAATPKRAILVRMLNNLAGIYGRDGDTSRSLEVLERLAALDPADARIAASLERLHRLVASLN